MIDLIDPTIELNVEIDFDGKRLWVCGSGGTIFRAKVKRISVLDKRIAKKS